MHATADELAAQLDHILAAPLDGGTVDLIVARPANGERTVLTAGELRIDVGLVGDNWLPRGASRTPDGSADPYAQLTIMSTRVVEAVAGERARWPLAGDQIYVDMQFGEANLPVGSRLSIGTAVVELSPTPHAGCAKFTERFGVEALQFVNAGEGRAHRLRGANAFVVQDGTFELGDTVRVRRLGSEEP